jgi:hypothetical protein
MDDTFQTVVGLGNAGRVEGVGFDDVGAGLQIVTVNCLDDLRPGEQQQVVVAFQIVRMVGETAAAIIGLLQRVTLDHGAHGAV